VSKKFFICLDLSDWGCREVRFWNSTLVKWTGKELATQYDTLGAADNAKTSDKYIIINLEA